MASVFRLNSYRETGPLSYQEYRSAKERLSGFEWMGAARIAQSSITVAGRSTLATVAAVTPDLAEFLQLPLDDGAIISHQASIAEFGPADQLRGQELRIDGASFRISGVAPEWLSGLYRDHPVDLWIPFQPTSPDDTRRNIWVVGRLAGAPLKLDTGDLRVFPYAGVTPELAESLLRIGALLELAGALLFVIACSNVGLFLLGRAFTRFKETALRVALGASRRQLARELIADSIVLSVAGGALGLLLAIWTSRILPALLFEEDAQHLIFAPNRSTIVAASLVCVAITILCGLLPLAGFPHNRPVLVLRRGNATPSPAIRRLRFGLVVAEMAGCCFLVISTAILLQGLNGALVTSAGRRLSHTLLANLKTPPAAGLRYIQQLEAAANSIAGVSAVGWTNRLPGSQPASQWLRIDPARQPLREISLDIDWFTPRSLELFSQGPKRGRMFGRDEQSCRAAIVNEAAANDLFGEDTPGRTVQAVASPPVEIIGVVSTRNTQRPTIYFDYTNRPGFPPRLVPAARFHAPITSDLARAELESNIVSLDYFDAMGIQLVAGHSFADHRDSTPCRLGILNQQAADIHFNGNAVGAALIDDRGRRTTIIGVVHTEPIGAFQRRVEPALFLPMSQDLPPRMTMIAHAYDVNDAVIAGLGRKLEAVPGQASVVVKPFDTYLTQTSLAPLHIATVVLAATAVIALLLSMLGLFGALNDAGRQRRRELAVRIALGAQRWRVIGQVLEEGGRLAGAGAITGMLGALVLSRWMAGITPPAGPPVFWAWLAAPVVLALAVAISSVIPARRAMVVSPIMIMRDDS